MIFIDDDTWPPSLHGTGMEDYFGHAWGMQHNAFLLNGTIVHEEDVPGFHHSYRFHMVDPIRFEKRIKVTFEHGHANHLSDDWSSTAYWYQTLPSAPCDIAPVEERLPLRPIDAVTEQTIRPEPTREQRSAREQAARRMAEFQSQRRRLSEERFASVRRSEQGNRRQAADIRARFDRQG